MKRWREEDKFGILDKWSVCSFLRRAREPKKASFCFLVESLSSTFRFFLSLTPFVPSLPPLKKRFDRRNFLCNPKRELSIGELVWPPAKTTTRRGQWGA